MYFNLACLVMAGYYVYKFRSDYKKEDIDKIAVAASIIFGAWLLLTIFFSWLF